MPDLNRSLSLLASHRPFHESDHVLTHVYNLYAGGTCIEDIADLQTSEPVRRLLGTDRIPDPTTAGDFLRRFDAGALQSLDQVIDHAQEKVWKRRYGKKKAERAIVDLDSCVRPVYGDQKEGTDFTYKEQGHLFMLTRFRYVLSNLPASVSAEEVMDLTYQRCDQENLIEQLQSGVAAMRMPTGGDALERSLHDLCATGT